jgi:hypothetical protein
METQLERLALEALKLTLDERAELAQLLLTSLDEDAEMDEVLAVQLERMRGTSEDAAHTEWMRQQLAESLADPSPNLSHEQVMADVQAVIDAKRKQHADKAAS